MKKFLALILGLIIASAALFGCDKDKKEYGIYCKNVDGDALAAELRKADMSEDADLDDVIGYLIGELTKSPKTEGLINALPDGVKLIGASVYGTTATVNLSKEYYRNKDVDELLSRIAIVNTLTSLDEIEGVVIKVEGKPLVSTTTGAEIGRIDKRSIAYGPQDKAITKKQTIVIYFPDENGEYLVPEHREIEVQASLSMERLVLSELLKGPSNEGLRAAVPSDIKVISAETKEGVCFVNLSGDLIEKVQGGSTATTMVVYSIVNSLTELDNIGSVQLLIDGKTGTEFGNFVLDAPIEKKISLIKE